jgi:hypothetical protein
VSSFIITAKGIEVMLDMSQREVNITSYDTIILEELRTHQKAMPGPDLLLEAIVVLRVATTTWEPESNHKSLNSRLK